MSDFTLEDLIEKKIARVKTIINHRTDYGTFEDEESELFEFLLNNRIAMQEELDRCRASIKKLTDQLMAGGGL